MEEPRLHIGAIVGSLRRESFTRAIAHTLDELAPDDVSVDLVRTLGDLPLYNEDVQAGGVPEAVLALAREVARSDAVVIVTPEYNYSVPGALKNALDWLSRLPDKPFELKPVAIQTASQGVLGGIRAQAHLRQVLLSLNAEVLSRPEVVIPLVASKVDPATGTLRDEATRARLAAQLAALGELTTRRWRRAA